MAEGYNQCLGDPRATPGDSLSNEPDDSVSGHRGASSFAGAARHVVLRIKLWACVLDPVTSPQPLGGGASSISQTSLRVQRSRRLLAKVSDPEPCRETDRSKVEAIPALVSGLLRYQGGTFVLRPNY